MPIYDRLSNNVFYVAPFKFCTLETTVDPQRKEIDISRCSPTLPCNDIYSCPSKYLNFEGHSDRAKVQPALLNEGFSQASSSSFLDVYLVSKECLAGQASTVQDTNVLAAIGIARIGNRDIPELSRTSATGPLFVESDIIRMFE